MEPVDVDVPSPPQDMLRFDRFYSDSKNDLMKAKARDFRSIAKVPPMVPLQSSISSSSSSNVVPVESSLSEVSTATVGSQLTTLNFTNSNETLPKVDGESVKRVLSLAQKPQGLVTLDDFPRAFSPFLV